jgi:hypothetical protein
MRSQIALAQGADDEALAWARKAEPLAANQRLERSELIWAYAMLAAASFRNERRDDANRFARLALEQITKGTPVTFYCIESYALVGQTFADLWQAGPAGRDLKRLALEANRAMAKFAKVFPAGRPRALLLDGRLADIRGRRAHAEKQWRRSLQVATQLEMEPDRAAALRMLGLANDSSPQDPNNEEKERRHGKEQFRREASGGP